MNWLSSFGQDLRYALRQLRLSPGFTAVAVLSLALGIGANTAIFQLVDAVRLRTLPVKDPHELVTIDFPRGSELAGRFTSRSARFTYAQWEEVRRNQEPFSGVLAWSAARFNLSPGGEARLAEGLYVSGDFFNVLGVTPMRGRTFTAADDTAACSNPGSVISYAFWQREFGGDEQILGRKVMIQGLPFPILGVTQPAFFGVEVGRRYDVAVPLCADPALAQDKKGRIGFRQDWWLSILARLKPGWTVQRANAYMQTIAPAVMRASLPPTYQPDVAKKYLQNKLTATEGATGVSGLRRQYERPLWLLLGTTGLVLLIACANLANLLLARASVREREVAVRQAIGASRARLVRQLLSESLLLASCGAVLGAALAQLLSRSLIAFLTTANSPLFVGIGLDARVFGFTCLVAVVTCVLFGLLPALRATQISPASAMRAGGRGTTSGRERFSLRRALVATQVALSLVLLVGALLFVRSLQNLINTDAGFHTEGIVSLSVDLRQLQYGPERLPVAYREVLQRLLSKPGVVSAAQVLITPLSGSGWNSDIGPDGARASGSGKDSLFNRVGPGYFQTMGTPLLAGRDFSETDTASAPKVAVVNEAFAKAFFGGANPLGRTFNVEADAGKPEDLYQVVGLVKNTKYYDLREEFKPVSYVPMLQDSEPGASTQFVIRINGPVAETLRNLKAAVAEVSPGIGLEYRFLSRRLQDSLMRERLMATLSGAFGLLAGLLATLGLYGVIAYMVARRRNEIGLRMALGAGRGSVVRLVLREAVLLLTVGFVAGGLLAVWAGRAIETMVFGLKPYDPMTMLAAMAMLAAVALAASYGPARKAASLDPMAALRDE